MPVLSTTITTTMLLHRIARPAFRQASSSSSTILPRSSSSVISASASNSRRSFAAAAGDKVVVVEDFKAFSDATTTNERSVAYFTASWCPPCRTISPVFATLSGKHADVKFLKVDVSRAREGEKEEGKEEGWNEGDPKSIGHSIRRLWLYCNSAFN